MLLSGAVLSSVAPGVGLYTSVLPLDGRNKRLIGQIIHPPGEQLAQLTFLAPESALDKNSLIPILDHLAAQVVDRGGFRLLAEVEEDSPAYPAMRDATFATYARQRVWRVPKMQTGENESDQQPESMDWQVPNDADLIPVRSLYHAVIPGLVQQVEPFPAERLDGLVFRHEGTIMAYLELKYGHRGIWVQPFIHPDAQASTERLLAVLHNIPNRRSRPVYVCVRSYQSWIEAMLEGLGAKPGPRQAVMVKHLAIAQKTTRPFALPSLEGGHPEITTPISQSQVSRSVVQQRESQ